VQKPIVLLLNPSLAFILCIVNLFAYLFIHFHGAFRALVLALFKERHKHATVSRVIIFI